MKGYRTDLACEELPLSGKNIPGVLFSSETSDGITVTRVKVTDEKSSSVLCKPIGDYITLDMEKFFRRDQNSFQSAVSLLVNCIRELLPLQTSDTILVVGLGNPAITPDAVGPQTTINTLATRHLTSQMPKDFSMFRPVSVFQTGVLGTTGVESAALVRSVCAACSPSAVVVIDALASRSSEKLCRTVQLTDSGIIPGSGVGNDRGELSAHVLGLPVLAIGVPTVVDAGDGLIITPRDIDRYVKDAGKLIGYGLNLALHHNLTVSDVDMFVG